MWGPWWKSRSSWTLSSASPHVDSQRCHHQINLRARCLFFFSTPDSNIRPMWIKFPLMFLLNIVHVLRVSDDACVLCPSSLPVWLTVRLQAINTHRQRQHQLCFTNTHSLTRVTWTSPLLSKTKIFFFLRIPIWCWSRIDGEQRPGRAVRELRRSVQWKIDSFVGHMHRQALEEPISGH